MEVLQLKVALRILEHAGISSCLVGEVALNYYNVPRALHDIEICVSEELVSKAAAVLHGTGLFEPDDIEQFDNYNEYKRGCPRFRSSSWISPACTLVILSDRHYGLYPLVENVIGHKNTIPNPEYSSQIMDLLPVVDVRRLPIPQLPPLLRGLCQRYLDSFDDVAMIAAEQLVDGMDLDEGWCERNLAFANQQVYQLASTLVAGKKSRLDHFSENSVTCFVRDPGEAARLRQIPGYE